jgi:hypothetical protein
MNKTCYRIYTEAKNVDGIKNLVKFYFDGTTIYMTDGFFEGQSEKSLVIEVILDREWGDGPHPNYSKVRTFAEFLKNSNEQKSVLITRTEVEVEII